MTHSNTSNCDSYVLQTYKVPNAPRTAPSENNPLQIFNEFWHVSREVVDYRLPRVYKQCNIFRTVLTYRLSSSNKYSDGSMINVYMSVCMIPNSSISSNARNAGGPYLF